MKNSHKQTLTSAIVIIIALVAFFGIRSWKMATVEEMILGDPLINGLLAESVNYDGEEYSIPPTHIYDTDTELPAINDPVFTTVSDADSYLADDVAGIDIEVNGQHRFYSYQMLNWHEVVNDDFDGVKLAVTHCALCKSSAVYNRELNGKELELENAQKIYNNNQLLEDQSGSLWLQIRGLAVSGKNIGSELELYQFTIMTWSDWKNLYPYGQVLSNQTGYTRDYTMHPYNNYDASTIIYYPTNFESESMGPKWHVSGLEITGEPYVFADTIMTGKYIANINVGGIDVVGLWDDELQITYAFNRNINNQVLTFEYDWGNQEFYDSETESIWNINGKAISGELQGSQLDPITTKTSYWMCWYAQYPESRVAHIEPIETEEQSEENTNE